MTKLRGECKIILGYGNRLDFFPVNGSSVVFHVNPRYRGWRLFSRDMLDIGHQREVCPIDHFPTPRPAPPCTRPTPPPIPEPCPSPVPEPPIECPLCHSCEVRVCPPCPMLPSTPVLSRSEARKRIMEQTEDFVDGAEYAVKKRSKRFIGWVSDAFSEAQEVVSYVIVFVRNVAEVYWRVLTTFIESWEKFLWCMPVVIVVWLFPATLGSPLTLSLMLAWLSYVLKWGVEAVPINIVDEAAATFSSFAVSQLEPDDETAWAWRFSLLFLIVRSGYYHSFTSSMVVLLKITYCLWVWSLRYSRLYQAVLLSLHIAIPYVLSVFPIIMRMLWAGRHRWKMMSRGCMLIERGWRYTRSYHDNSTNPYPDIEHHMREAYERSLQFALDNPGWTVHDQYGRRISIDASTTTDMKSEDFSREKIRDPPKDGETIDQYLVYSGTALPLIEVTGNQPPPSHIEKEGLDTSVLTAGGRLISTHPPSRRKKWLCRDKVQPTCTPETERATGSPMVESAIPTPLHIGKEDLEKLLKIADGSTGSKRFQTKRTDSGTSMCTGLHFSEDDLVKFSTVPRRNWPKGTMYINNDLGLVRRGLLKITRKTRRNLKKKLLFFSEASPGIVKFIDVLPDPILYHAWKSLPLTCSRFPGEVQEWVEFIDFLPELIERENRLFGTEISLRRDIRDAARQEFLELYRKDGSDVDGQLNKL